MEKRTDQGLKAMLTAAFLLVGLMLAAASARATEALPYIGTEQELLRRAEGRVQRAVLDRLLGAGRARVLLEKAPVAAVPRALAELAGKTEESKKETLTAAIVLEEDFEPQRLDLVRKELRATLKEAGFETGAVDFRLRDSVEQAIEDAQFAIYQSDLDKAFKRAQYAVKTAPDNLTALQLLGSVYFLQGKKDQARAAWTEVMRRDPQNTVVPAFLARLKTP